MSDKIQEIPGLNPDQYTYEKKCFIGHSQRAQWCADLLGACEEVLQLPEFNLEPWYAESHNDPDKSLLDTVVDMIANARYGIYDLSGWREESGKSTGEWFMPHNVFIELGMAIALNRPILLLQHEESCLNGPKLPECLESIRDRILPFTGKYDLKKVLKQYLPQWIRTTPQEDWRNSYCLFGEILCAYREAHPLARYWGKDELPGLIFDGPTRGCSNFHGLIEEVFENFSSIRPSYISAHARPEGVNFQLCTYCHGVRTAPLTIYRLTADTPGETFITIGISIALSTQFKYRFPKIIIAKDIREVPSLLAGEKLIVEEEDINQQKRLEEYLPPIIRLVRSKYARLPVPLPFIVKKPVLSPKPIEKDIVPETDSVVTTQDILSEKIPLSSIEDEAGTIPEAKVTQILSAKEKMQLSKLLLECPTMVRLQVRNMVLQDLRKEIFASIIRDDQNDLLDIRSIINSCLHYKGGLHELIEIIRSYEAGSVPMLNIDAFMEHVSPEL